MAPNLDADSPATGADIFGSFGPGWCSMSWNSLLVVYSLQAACPGHNVVQWLVGVQIVVSAQPLVLISPLVQQQLHLFDAVACFGGFAPCRVATECHVAIEHHVESLSLSQSLSLSLSLSLSQSLVYLQWSRFLLPACLNSWMLAEPLESFHNAEIHYFLL